MKQPSMTPPLPYSAPTGRASSTNGPGLGGSNLGNSGTQGKGAVPVSTSGRPGLSGTVMPCGTQGKR
jgi:hypothetical protein